MTWFGHSGEALAQALSLPRVEAHETLASAMDGAHALAAAGAAAGTLVLAESQTAGRGRGGKHWHSAPRAGIWAALLERPRDARGLEVLSLRVGLGLARVFSRWTSHSVQLKWPNDLFVNECKLAGVLIEARWRDQRPDWVVIGVGVNLVVPEGQGAASLKRANPLEVLAEMIPALRAAAFASGTLSSAELAEFAARDFANGRRLQMPAAGTARGITADGALLIESNGAVAPYRAGSLVLST